MRSAIFFVMVSAVVQLGPARAGDSPTGTDFSAWLEGLRTDATEAGITAATLDTALTGLQPIPRVIELDRAQPEFTQTFAQYLAARVSAKRIARGREMMAGNRESLTRVAARYRVQPRFIAAIWGMETNYGSFTGSYPVIASLATLAHDGRRSDFFRSELIDALKIVDEGHISVAAMVGSWAGAMGQSQFMPSSFLQYARDQNGDGRADIWTDRADVFASIANYLAAQGWSDDQTWGREVRLPPGFEQKISELMPASPPRSCRRALRHHTVRLTLAEWQALGVRRLNGADLPVRALKASLVLPGGAGARAYLTYGDFRSILRYNCSNYYAVAVGTLADRIAK